LDAIDEAPDPPGRRGIAVAGVEDQLRRFREGRTDQSYLELCPGTRNEQRR
jgi:hypothetical protein